MIALVTTTASDFLPTAAAASLALIAIVTLATLLMQKEAVSGLSGLRVTRWDRALNIALLPLTFVLVLTIILKLASVWR
ncbi:MAG: hypothetical protein GX552_09240 [Chloroflexi bacterium]|jgi:hypothetical protein|nr:hypothetical protein [Chloroflexota bacterium]